MTETPPPAAILHPHLVDGDPADPSAVVVNVTAPSLSGIATVQAANDDILRALLDQIIDQPEGLRDSLLVARASLEKGN